MSNNLPPGYRFYPTEEELLSFYLNNKLGSRREADMERVIPVANIYHFDPWQLPQISGEPCIQDSEQWFFFCPRQEREIHGGRPTRTAPSGYWKATGSPSQVYSSTNRLIGVKKTMVFYIGRAPTGTKTKWKMNEYRAIEEDPTAMPDAAPKLRKEFSLCRVYKNLGCLRSFDRRPSVASTASASQRVPDASSNDDGNHSGRKRTRSHDSSSRDDNGSSHCSLHDDLKMLEDIDWEQLDCL